MLWSTLLPTAGSYLVACTHFATVYGISPVGIEYTAGLDASVAAIMQQAAAKILNDKPQVPEADWLSSVGVSGGAVVDYGIDNTATVNLKAFPASEIVSVVDGSFGGRSFSGLLGDKGENCSLATSAELTAAQLADLADISYGVSVIGAATMSSTTKNGTTFTGLSALVNGHWGSSWMANWVFGTTKYDITGKASDDG